ncbi:hypothetical protein [Azospirillum sp. TSO35-2]|uniref:hypothetical protein n=1 Tax=Azospirillum sp. TSO35-2 TaxID=716796 RepID=UPI000D604BD7|nr:hypothetical protein [Azospirillum sp. TSO35-2]PWC31004.1 hypothetical protein TSO352_29565 [Azospirillum sp. TSO35-2]
MSLFAAWTGVVIAAARIEPAPSAHCRPPPVPEPRRIRLTHNPMLPPVPAALPVRRAGPPSVEAEPLLEASLRTPLLLGK